MTQNARVRLLALLCLVLLAAVWLLGIGRKPIVFEDMSNPYRDVRLEFRDGKKSFYADQGDSYGVLTGGPGLLLSSGVYRLDWIIETDAENTIHIVSGNGAKIEPSEITIAADTWADYAEFEIMEDAANVEFQIDFQAGSALRVQKISLSTPAYTDGTWSITFLILGAAVLAYGVLKRKMDAQRTQILLVIALAVFIVSAPSLKPSIYMGHDACFHMLRVRNLMDSLRAGQIPARVGGYAYSGYGAVLSAFYPDLFCYFPALLMMTGASFAYAMSALQIAIHVLTALSMYLCGRRILSGAWQGCCAAVLYTLASYRITDVYTRFALGEALAMAFLPVFLLGIYEVFFGDKQRWRLLVLGATCVFQSHMLSTLMCAASALLLGILFLPRLIRERRMDALLKAIVGTLMVNLFFLVPFMTLSKQGVSASMLIGRNSERALSMAQLLLQRSEELEMAFRDSTLEVFPLEIGFPLLLGGMLGLMAALTSEDGVRRRKTLLLCGAGAAFAFATTDLFPWEGLSALTNGMSDYLQFPWRLLVMTDAMLALAGGIGICALAEGKDRQAAVLTLVMAVFAALPYLTALTLSNRVLLPHETVTADFMVYDYTLPGTDFTRLNEREPVTEGNVRLSDWEKTGTRMRAQVEADEASTLTLPVFGFDGYAAEVEGVRMEVGLGDNNRLMVHLPADTRGTLRVWYEGKRCWRIFDVISLVTALALLAKPHIWREKQRMGSPGKLLHGGGWKGTGR